MILQFPRKLRHPVSLGGSIMIIYNSYLEAVVDAGCFFNVGVNVIIISVCGRKYNKTREEKNII